MLKTIIKNIFILIFKDERGECDYPNDIMESLAESFLPYIIAFFESREGQNEYAKWEESQQDNN